MNTVKNAESALPEMVRAARRNFGTEAEQKTAVLLAWTQLAGMLQWTPRMVSKVERLMRAAAGVVLVLTAMSMAPGARAATTVSEARVVNGAGERGSGKIRIAATVAFRSSSGAWVSTSEKVVAVANGRFSVALEPSAAGTSYSVRWELNGDAPMQQYWVVPMKSSAAVDDCVAQRKGPGLVVQMTWGNAVGTWGGSN